MKTSDLVNYLEELDGIPLELQTQMLNLASVIFNQALEIKNLQILLQNANQDYENMRNQRDLQWVDLERVKSTLDNVNPTLIHTFANLVENISTVNYSEDLTRIRVMANKLNDLKTELRK